MKSQDKLVEMTTNGSAWKMTLSNVDIYDNYLLSNDPETHMADATISGIWFEMMLPHENA